MITAGDLVRIKLSTTRIPRFPLGIVLKETLDIAVETKFFEIIMPDGTVKQFSGDYLEKLE